MANETREHDAFIRQINELSIELSVNYEGVFTACTHAEPFFCFDAPTREEVAELARRALISYGEHFYGLKGLTFSVLQTNSEDGPLAVERGIPLGQLKPQYDLAG